MNKVLSFLIIVSLCSLTSCGIFNKKSIPSLNQTSWTLSKINNFPQENLAKPVTINFENDKINGFSGCNNYSANVKKKVTNIQFTEIMGSMKACQPGSTTESAFLGVLKNTTDAQIKSGKLYLKSGNKVLAEFEQNKKQ